jgi:hypothetical protein
MTDLSKQAFAEDDDTYNGVLARLIGDLRNRRKAG